MHCGCGGQSAGDGDGAAVAGREVRGIVVARVGDADQIEQPVDHVVVVLRVVVLPEFKREEDVFGDGERIEERSALENHGDFAADTAEFRFAEIRNVFVGDDDPTLVRLQEAHDVAQADRLALPRSDR